ncbi:MAG: VWA domain-containing protein [Mycobacterium sp.]
MTAPLLLRGVDRAALAVALVAKLRAAGVTVSASGPAAFVAALDHLGPRSRRELYWAARLTLVNRAEDLASFDAVISALFDDAVAGLDPPSRKSSLGRAAASVPGADRARGGTLEGSGLPWATRPRSITAAAAMAGDDAVRVPDTLPSRLLARADEAFEEFDDDDLRIIGTWLEHASAHWPRRRSMRREPSVRGTRVDLRQTMRASRTTGWEVLRLIRTRRRRHPRRVVLLCDVSRSMQPYATIYLHLMRAAAVRRTALTPEVFAFSTSLTRLTPVLAHRSAEVALARANAKVTDRYGGTHLGRSLAALLAGPHGSAVRGAVVIIASDGWDGDPPEVLDAAMARLRRRAGLIVWLNPRAAADGYRPLAGSMACALPYCDVFMPAHSMTGLRELFDALSV